MILNELKQNLDAILLSGVSPHLISGPGIGKSTMVDEFILEQEAKTKEPWFYQVVTIATMTAPDLYGYMFKNEYSWADYNEGRPTTVSDPTMPIWMLDRRTGKPASCFKRGVLFLDEWGQGEADVKRGAAPLVYERAIGKWRLHDGIGVISATNRKSDRSGVSKEFDFVINRRVEYPITPDLESWKQWAFTHGVSPTLITFADQNPNLVFAEDLPEEQGPWCTPRSLCQFGKIAERLRIAAGLAEGKFPLDAFAIETAHGCIGRASAAQLISTIRLGNEMPDFLDIVNDPKGVKVPGAVDAQILVTHRLAALVDTKTIAPVVKYMERMSEEFGIVFAKSAIRRMPSLLPTPAVTDWVSRNSALINAVQSI